MAGARALEKDSLSGVSRILSWISEGRERKCGAERKDFLSWMRASERRREINDEPGALPEQWPHTSVSGECRRV